MPARRARRNSCRRSCSIDVPVRSLPSTHRRSTMKTANKWLLSLTLVCGSLVALPAHAGKTLDQIKQRGQLVCGVNTGLAGFAAADSQGNWTGLDVDVCRAVEIGRGH